MLFRSYLLRTATCSEQLPPQNSYLLSVDPQRRPASMSSNSEQSQRCASTALERFQCSRKVTAQRDMNTLKNTVPPLSNSRPAWVGEKGGHVQATAENSNCASFHRPPQLHPPLHHTSCCSGPAQPGAHVLVLEGPAQRLQLSHHPSSTDGLRRG